MHMGEEERREFHSCFGTLHTSVSLILSVKVIIAFKIVVGYYVVWCTVLAATPMPFLNFYFGIVGLLTCASAGIGIYVKNVHFFTPFLVYAIFSIFLLLYLGCYYFFVTIFNKDEIAEKIGTWFDDLFFLVHFLDVMCLLIHYYTLGIITKNRAYLQSLNGKVCSVHAHDPSSALRSDSEA